jgi:hypothetical protein
MYGHHEFYLVWHLIRELQHMGLRRALQSLRGHYKCQAVDLWKQYRVDMYLFVTKNMHHT